MAFLWVDAGGLGFWGLKYLRFQTVKHGGAGGERVQRGRVAGWPRVVKHHGVPLYEWNQVPRRSLLLVQLSRGAKGRRCPGLMCL